MRTSPGCCSLGVAVVACAFITDALALGARSFFPVVLETWEEEFGWSRSRVSGARALMYAAQGVVTPIAGHYMDIMDARSALAGGLAYLSTTLLLTSFIAHDWQMWLVFGVMGGTAFGCLNLNVFAAAITRYVEPRHRGAATGIATSGSTFGQLLLVPLFALLVSRSDANGWRRGYQIAAAAAAAMAFASHRVLAPQLQAEAKAEAPAAAAAAAAVAPGAASPPTAPSAPQKLRVLLRSRDYWALGLAFFICGVTTTGFIESHIVALCTHRGHSTTDGALVFGVISALNGIGMIGAGWLSDRYSRTALLAAIYAGRALAYVALRFGASSRAELLLFAVLFGLVDYSVVPPTVSLVETHFGANVVGLGVGVLLLWHSLGASLGAWWGGASFDERGDYRAVLLTAVLLCCVAAVLVLTIPEPWRREHATADDAADGATATAPKSATVGAQRAARVEGGSAATETAVVVVRADALERALSGDA